MHSGLAHDADARRLAAIVESSDDAIVSKDLNGIVASWNRAAERMFGYTAAEAVGRSITIIIPEDRLHEETEVLRRIRAGQMVDHFETIRRHKSGALIPISLTVSPILNERGIVIGASKIARDISDRRRAEAATAAAEAARADLQRRLLALTSAAGTLLVSPDQTRVLDATMSLARDLIDADGYAVWQLDRSARVWRTAASFGVSPEFLRAITPSNDAGAVPFREPLFIEDVFAAPMLEMRRDDYAKEGIQSLLVVPMTIGGAASATLVFYYRRRRAMSAEDVQAGGALGSLAAAAIATANLYGDQRRDKERWEFLGKASTALGASLDYMDTLKTVAHLAVPQMADWCAVDLLMPGGRIERLAVAHVDPAKVEKAHDLGRRFPTTIDAPSGAGAVIRTGRSLLIPFLSEESIVASLSHEPERLALVRSLGIVSFMSVPLRIQGTAVGAITFVSAESGRRFGDDDLRFAEELAVRAGVAIENARAYEEARQANRVKDAFLATLSHELRTPLNAILGYTRMLRQAAVEPPRQAHALEVIERNANSLRQMVNDVLDVSGIVSGKLRLKMEPVDAADVVAESVETVLPAATAKHIGIEIAAREPLAIAGDADRLRQVFWNVLSNAVKFTPSGGGPVRVTAHRGGGNAVIEITDQGAGIPREFVAHVFEPFRQADSPFTREHGGLGLGLAITRHIVEMHGGTIRADSSGPGSGSTFTITLPISS